MKNILKKLFALVFVLSIVFVAGCSNGDDTSDSQETVNEADNETVSKEEPIRVGNVSGTSTLEVAAVAKEVLKNQGYIIEEEVFNDYQSPNTAVAEGTLDFNFYQHGPFLEEYNKANDTDLVTVGDGVYNVSYGLYSTKIDSLDEIEDGMTVAIQSDNSNRKVSLQMLEENGLITLEENVDNPTIQDIKDNPHNLVFQEMEETMIPTAVEDVDLAMCSGSKWQAADRSMDEAIVLEYPESSTIYLVTTKEKADSPEAKLLQEAFESDEVKEFILTEFDGVAAPVS